jgi:hypothetical protein
MSRLRQLVDGQSQAEVEKPNEDVLFGRSVAATLQRFSNHQKAYAKLQTQQVLMEIEFADNLSQGYQGTVPDPCGGEFVL